MYYLEKTVVVSSAHHLEGYEGKCANVHGHDWKITVFCKGEKLDKIGMLIDFVRISEIVKQLDHTDINKRLGSLNPTAENIAKWICSQVLHCYKVRVIECEGSVCTYERD